MIYINDREAGYIHGKYIHAHFTLLAGVWHGWCCIWEPLLLCLHPAVTPLPPENWSTSCPCPAGGMLMLFCHSLLLLHANCSVVTWTYPIAYRYFLVILGDMLGRTFNHGTATTMSSGEKKNWWAVLLLQWGAHGYTHLAKTALAFAVNGPFSEEDLNRMNPVLLTYWGI